MKKKLLSAMLITAMTASLLAGCGGAKDETSADPGTAAQEQQQEAAAPEEEAPAEVEAAADEGKVLNIYCWND